MSKPIITLRVPDRMLQELNEIIFLTKYDSRSEAIREALTDFIQKEKEFFK